MGNHSNICWFTLLVSLVCKPQRHKADLHIGGFLSFSIFSEQVKDGKLSPSYSCYPLSVILVDTTANNIVSSRASMFTRINGNVSCKCDKRLQNLHII